MEPGWAQEQEREARKAGKAGPQGRAGPPRKAHAGLGARLTAVELKEVPAPSSGA